MAKGQLVRISAFSSLAEDMEAAVKGLSTGKTPSERAIRLDKNWKRLAFGKIRARAAVNSIGILWM